MCEFVNHATDEFEKIIFLKIFEKIFGEGNLFIVSLQRISKKTRIWLSLSSRISLVTVSCFAGSKTGIKFRANKRKKQRHIMPENKHTLLTRSPKIGRYIRRDQGGGHKTKF